LGYKRIKDGFYRRFNMSIEKQSKPSIKYKENERFKIKTIKPKVKDGKILLDKNNKDHRYIMEEE